MRIVSLLSGATELICALGAGDELVGRSHECDHPEWVKGLPSCTRPTFDVSGSSLEIDRRVRELLRQGEPLYRVDGELLAQLQPDVVVAQAHCEVCAVGPADIRRDAVPGALAQPSLVELTAGSLDEMFRAFVRVACGIGREERGRAYVAGLQARLRGIAAKVAGERRVRVECLEWIDPIFPMGNWSPELVELAGGDTRLGRPGAHSAATNWDRVRQADPEVLIVAPCGFDLSRTESEMPALVGRPGWNALRAVTEGKVFLADGNRYFNRSGPSIVETAEILAEILHPDRFAPRHEGHGWRNHAIQPLKH